MKTNEIIETLRSALFDERGCQREFEKYDVELIQANTEPFFWLCTLNGTHFVRCGANSINNMLLSESNRIAIFRNPNAPIEPILYYKDTVPCKCYFWNGFNLQRVTFDEVAEIWNNLASASIESARKVHSTEYAVSNMELEIKFVDREDEFAYYEACDYGISLHDTSLPECVTRLSQWARVAVDHCIEIRKDFSAEYGFSFVERINGKVHTNGGIISDFRQMNKRWQIHT